MAATMILLLFIPGRILLIDYPRAVHSFAEHTVEEGILQLQERNGLSWMGTLDFSLGSSCNRGINFIV